MDQGQRTLTLARTVNWLLTLMVGVNLLSSATNLISLTYYVIVLGSYNLKSIWSVSRSNRYCPKRKKNLTQSRKEFAIYNEIIQHEFISNILQNIQYLLTASKYCNKNKIIEFYMKCWIFWYQTLNKNCLFTRKSNFWE